MRIKLKELTAISNGQASQFRNKKQTDGSPIPIELDLEKEKAYVYFTPTDVMIINLGKIDMYRYTVDDTPIPAKASLVLVSDTNEPITKQ
jgi:hypothetical protein